MSRWRAGLISLTIVGVGILVVPAAAGAGGWAVSTVDPMGVPVAGATTEVGFTIRQHGVQPVNPEEQVGIGIRSESGAEKVFPATASGAQGHYVARVRFPEPGRYRWRIQQGWFGPQDLGRITVSSPVSAAGTVDGDGSGSTYRGSFPVRVLLPVLGIGLGTFAVADAWRSRRRRSRGVIAT